MQSKKTQRHTGQQPLISEYDTPKPEHLPRGMPTLAMIKTETTLHGLPESDAEHLYDCWLQNGFRTGSNGIKNWRATVRIWIRQRFFPSLKQVQPKPSELMTYEILDDIAKWTAFKKLDVHREGAEFKEWCEKNKKPKLVSSFIKRLNAKL